MARYRKARAFKNNIKKVLTVVMLALGIAAAAWFFLGRSGVVVRNADNAPSLAEEEQGTDNVPSSPKEDSDVSGQSGEVEFEKWLGITASVIGIIVGLIEIVKYITGNRSSRS